MGLFSRSAADRSTEGQESDRRGQAASALNNSSPRTGETTANNKEEAEGDDEDEWDRRIKRTGCFEENERLQICHVDTGDWRKCMGEMAAFKECMKQHGRFTE
ncbi:hypothetical protein GQ54DRAFT_299349 [Martensiomyces pterosporus]|nr:hypothetical protein GQ54DRAFT_299349 [Martensiomyces pterosporus]